MLNQQNITSDYLSNLGRNMATQNIIINIKKHMNMLQLMLFLGGERESCYITIKSFKKTPLVEKHSVTIAGRNEPSIIHVELTRIIRSLFLVTPIYRKC